MPLLLVREPIHWPLSFNMPILDNKSGEGPAQELALYVTQRCERGSTDEANLLSLDAVDHNTNKHVNEQANG